MENDFNFGITDTTELQVGEGHSSLFSDPQEIEEIKQEEEKPKDNFLKEEGSALFSDEEKEEPKKEAPKQGKKELGEIPEPQAEPEDEDEPEEGSEYEEYAKQWFEAGILTPFEGDDEIVFDSVDKIKERFQLEKTLGAQTIVNNYLSSKGEKARAAFDAIIDKGIDPEIYYQKTTKIEKLEEADLEDVSTQERLVRTYYQGLGWKQEAVDKKVNKLKEYDDLSDEASIAKDNLIKVNQEELAREQQAAEQRLQHQAQTEQYYKQTLQQNLDNALAKKELRGLPMTNKVAAEVYDMMTTKKWKLQDGKEITDYEKILMELRDPKNIEDALTFALLKRNNFDFSSIEKKAVSKESNNLFKSLKQKSVSKKSEIIPSSDNFLAY